MDYVGKYAIERRTEQFKDLQYFKNKYTDDKLTTWVMQELDS